MAIYLSISSCQCRGSGPAPVRAQVNRVVVGSLLLSGVLAGVLTLSASVFAADEPPRNQKELKVRYERMLEAPFMKKIPWHLEYRKAAAAAKEKYLPLLIYHTRSDKEWPPSDAVQTGPLVSEWWVAAKDRFVPYIYIESGLAQPDQGLVKGFGSKLPPRFFLIDNLGEQVNSFHLDSEEDLERNLGEVEELMAARKAVKEDGKNKVAKARLVLLEGMRKKEADLAALSKAAQTPGLDAELIGRFERFRSAIPVQEALDNMNRELSREGASGNAGNSARVDAIHASADTAMFKLFKGGIRIKEKSERLFDRFWSMTFRGAIIANDRPAAEECFQVYDRAYGGDANQKTTIDKMREEMAKLK